jgi:ABC-type spermidine/putrescine transport system permease subunit II
MTRELITQRIKYLIEEGGVLDDPITELRRDVKRALHIAVAAMVVCTVVGTVTAVCVLR